MSIVLFILTLGVGVVATLSGLAWWAPLRSQWRRDRLLRDVPTSTPDRLAEGPVGLEGTAIPVDDPVEAPFSGASCVAYEYEVRVEFGPSPEDPDGGAHGGWEMLEDPPGADQTDFFVEQNGERARVDVRQLSGYLPEDTQTWTFDPDTPLPDPIETVLEQQGLDRALDASRPRKCIERRLETGETAYVTGVAERTEDSNGWRITTGPDDGWWVYSHVPFDDQRPPGLLGQTLAATGLLAVGAAGLAAAVYLLF